MVWQPSPHEGSRSREQTSRLGRPAHGHRAEPRPVPSDRLPVRRAASIFSFHFEHLSSRQDSRRSRLKTPLDSNVPLALNTRSVYLKAVRSAQFPALLTQSTNKIYTGFLLSSDEPQGLVGAIKGANVTNEMKSCSPSQIPHLPSKHTWNQLRTAVLALSRINHLPPHTDAMPGILHRHLPSDLDLQPRPWPAEPRSLNVVPASLVPPAQAIPVLLLQIYVPPGKLFQLPRPRRIGQSC